LQHVANGLRRRHLSRRIHFLGPFVSGLPSSVGALVCCDGDGRRLWLRNAVVFAVEAALVRRGPVHKWRREGSKGHVGRVIPKGGPP
jgi:hypothetical protein